MSEPLCCICGKNEIATAHLRPAPDGHKFEANPLHRLFFGTTEPNTVVVDKNGRVLTAPSLMRVMIEDKPGMPQFGVPVGLLLDEHGDTQAVVRLDHYGILLKAVHPSKVTPITPEEEASYKP